MLTFFLTAALVGVFFATALLVFKACLDLFDSVCKQTKGFFKALKVLILGEDGITVSSGVIVGKEGGEIILHEGHQTATTTIDDLDKQNPELARMLNQSPQRPRKMAGLETESEADEAIRRRVG